MSICLEHIRTYAPLKKKSFGTLKKKHVHIYVLAKNNTGVHFSASIHLLMIYVLNLCYASTLSRSEDMISFILDGG